MRTATTLGCGLLCLLLVAPVVAQQRVQQRQQALQQQYGPNYEEILDKYAAEPQKLLEAQQAYARQQMAGVALDASKSISALDDHFIGRAEVEPNNFFDTADDISDVIAMDGWRNSVGTETAEFNGKLLQASFDGPGDVDVFKFTADVNKMYYFASTHSFLSDGTDGLDVSMRLYHESDLDTTLVVDFNGVSGNEQIKGDILGRNTDGRNGSGDFRLTGWTPPVTDQGTGAKLEGTYYLFVFNEGGSAGTYFITTYNTDFEPFISRDEPNQAFEDALINGATVPTDAVVRSYMLFNPDTVKVVTTSGGCGAASPCTPLQSNGTYAQLYAQGDEDVDHFLLNGLANHTMVIETLPYFGWYRTPEGELGPGGSRLSDPRIRLYNADYTNKIDEDDDGAREQMDGPGNIHSRIVYDVPEDGPLWLWVSGWASNTRTFTDDGSFRAVDNRDPGRMMYDLYVHQYTNDLIEANSEPNDDFASAMPIASRADTVVTGNFASGTDVDVYRVFLHEHRMYSMFSQNASFSGDAQVALFHEEEMLDGTKVQSADLLAGNTVAGALGNGNFLVTGFVPPKSGAYLLQLTAPSAGDYQLVMFDTEVYPNRTANEPDDAPSDALARDKITIGIGAPRQNGMIFPAGDVDHYQFNGVAGQQVNFKLQSQAWRLANIDFDADMSLLDANLNVLATGNPAADAYSSVSATLPADGVYIIQIKAGEGTTDDRGSSNVGFYSLNVGEPVREIEPNNDAANATVLLDGFIAGTFTAGDVDYYSVPVQANHIYHLRSLNNDLGETMGVDLFNAADPATSLYDGSEWEGRYSSGNFKMQIIPDADGEYLVRLDAPGSLGGGNYEIHIKSNFIGELKTAFEPNDDFAGADASAHIVPDGRVHQSMLFNAANADNDWAYDADYYRIDISDPGKTLRCESIPFDGPNWGRDTDMYIELYDASGNLLTENDDNGVTLEDGTTFDDWHSKVEFAIESAGTYYCLIRSQDSPDNHTDRDPTTAEYKFRISYTSEEAEPNDDTASATPLVAQGATNASFSAAGEVDVFSMSLKAGWIYHVRTFKSDDMDDFGAVLSTDAAPGTEITTSESGSWRTRNNGGNIKLNIIPDQDQTYFLALTAPGEGEYQVMLKGRPLEPLNTAFEPNNTFAEADAGPSLPGDGAPIEAMLYNPNVDGFQDDVDIYRITANVGDTLVGYTMPFDGELWPRDFDAYMYLYGPGTTVFDGELATNDDGSFDWHSRIEHVAEVAGDYYFVVVGQDAHVPPRNDDSDRWRDPARGEYLFFLESSGDGGPVSNETDGLPETFTLGDNYPNPFNPSTTFAYTLPEAADIKLQVFNVLGQHVATLVEGLKTAGRYNVRFDASHLSSGMYLYRLEAGDFVMTKRMLLIK